MEQIVLVVQAVLDVVLVADVEVPVNINVVLHVQEDVLLDVVKHAAQVAPEDVQLLVEVLVLKDVVHVQDVLAVLLLVQMSVLQLAQMCV